MQDRNFLRASIFYAKAAYHVLTTYTQQNTYTDLNNLANLSSISSCPNPYKLMHHLNALTDRKILQGAETIRNLLSETSQHNTHIIDNSISIMLAIINGLTAAYCTSHGIEIPISRRNITDPVHPPFQFPNNATCQFCNYPLHQHYDRCPNCNASSTNDTIIPTSIPFPQVTASSEYDFPQFPLPTESRKYYAILRAIYITTKEQTSNQISFLAERALLRLASIRYRNPSTFTTYIHELMYRLVHHYNEFPAAIVEMINEMAMTLDPTYVRYPPLEPSDICDTQQSPNISLPSSIGERCIICNTTITRETNIPVYYNDCPNCIPPVTCEHCGAPLPLYNNPNLPYLATYDWTRTISSNTIFCESCGRGRHIYQTHPNIIRPTPSLPPISSKQEHTIGIEVEGSIDTSNISTTDWKITTDCSIRDLPFPVELQSRIIKSTELHTFLKKNHRLLSNIQVNNTCGLHIHIGARALSWFDIYRIMIYCTVYEHTFYSTQPRARRNARYTGKLLTPTGIKTKKQFLESMYNKSNIRANVGLKYPYGANISRNTWLNVHSRLCHGTLEFRLHSGTSDTLKIYHWIQFLISSIEHAIYVHPSKWNNPLNVCPEQTRTHMIERIKKFGEQPSSNRVPTSHIYSLLEGTNTTDNVITNSTRSTVRLAKPEDANV